MPTEDLTSDLNSETDFNTNANTNNSSFTSSVRNHQKPKGNELIKSERINMKIDFNNSTNHINNNNNNNNNSIEDEIKTPDFDADYGFQVFKQDKTLIVFLSFDASQNIFSLWALFIVSFFVLTF